MSDWFEAEQRVERAQQLFESQRWAEALAELEAALSINPSNASWHAQHGFLLEELDRLEEAVGAYTRSLELEPGDTDVALSLGVVLARLGRFARALEVFEEVSRLQPDLEAAYCHRIGIYAELGRHDQAEEMFYLAQELDASCPHCFFHIGASLAARGQTERAIYCWERVLELEPGYLGVKWRIGQAYRAQGKLEEAREQYLEELRENPGDIGLLRDLADLSLQMGQLATAAARFSQIIELDPECSEAQFALGKIWLRQNQPGEALKCFEAITSAGGGDLDIPEVEFRIGEALFRLGRFPEARRHLEIAVEQEGRNPGLLALLGDCLLASEKPEAAADCYRRVLALDARNPFANNNVGVCLLRAGRHASGLQHCLEAIRLKPDYVMAMHNASLAHLHLAQWREARAMLSRARRYDPENKAVRELAGRLWRYRLQYYARRLLAPFGLLSGRSNR